MTSMITFALLAALGTTVLAVQVAAQAYQLRQGTYLNVNPAGIYGEHALAPNGRVSLLENYGRRIPMRMATSKSSTSVG